VPESETIAGKVFPEELQRRFAVLSCDRNPMHLDPVIARRTQAGLPVVHGIHTILWGLETLFSSGRIRSSLKRIKVKFLKWVYWGDEALLRLPLAEQVDPKIFTIEVAGMLAISVELLYGNRNSIKDQGARAPAPSAPLSEALNLAFAELDSRSGSAFTATAEDVKCFFPHLTAAIGPAALAEIIACSYIVGMEAPGLHSIFSRLDVTICTPQESGLPRAALHYRVTALDERFRKITVKLTGNGLEGMLEAFVRVPPVEQPSIETVAAHVGASEFAGMNALIVGGSRGLGEVTAKVIAAGGGASTITHSMGKVEAEDVARQIGGWGANIRVMPYDVRLPPEPQLANLSPPPTHVFYFATNSIFRPKGALVSPSILAEFTAFYLQGFHDLCLQLTNAGKSAALTGYKLIAYYPSSVAVDDRPSGMTEYAMVKAAGEQMCRDMNRYVPGLRILTTRLPRLLTDQTAGVLPVHSFDPIGVLLPIVREMQNLSNGS
jgi:acyl dehydratase